MKSYDFDGMGDASLINADEYETEGQPVAAAIERLARAIFLLAGEVQSMRTGWGGE